MSFSTYQSSVAFRLHKLCTTFSASQGSSFFWHCNLAVRSWVILVVSYSPHLASDSLQTFFSHSWLALTYLSVKGSPWHKQAPSALSQEPSPSASEGCSLLHGQGAFLPSATERQSFFPTAEKGRWAENRWNEYHPSQCFMSDKLKFAHFTLFSTYNIAGNLLVLWATIRGEVSNTSGGFLNWRNSKPTLKKDKSKYFLKFLNILQYSTFCIKLTD